MTRNVIALCLLIIPPLAGAHPHALVEQQVSLSLGRTQAVVSYLIRPSTSDGAHMFMHLDVDGDTLLTAGEKEAFGLELIDATRLVVDGVPGQLQLLEVVVPDHEMMSAGEGLIKVKASTMLQLDSSRDHEILLDVHHKQFADSWFVQPHYFSDLVDGTGMPELNRSAVTSSISIHVPGEGSPGQT